MNTLSRTKHIIQKQLPEKTDQVVFCPLTPMQLEVYKRILSTEDVKSLIDGDARCDCGSNKQYAPFWLYADFITIDIASKAQEVLPPGETGGLVQVHVDAYQGLQPPRSHPSLYVV